MTMALGVIAKRPIGRRQTPVLSDGLWADARSRLAGRPAAALRRDGGRPFVALRLALNTSPHETCAGRARAAGKGTETTWKRDASRPGTARGWLSPSWGWA